jgi:hypothetical protein
MAVIKIVPMPGAVGDKGDEGAVGPQGPQGAQGLQGVPGADALWSYNGEWQVNSSYATGDVVTYQGQLYYTKSVTTAGTLPTVTAKFDLIASKGADGQSGTNGTNGADGAQGEQGPQGEVGPMPFNYQGDFDYGVTYAGNDAVTFNGGLWKLNNFIGAAGYAPTPGQWTLIIPAGTPGADGEDGEQGPQGDTGSPGLVYLGNYISGNGYIANLAVVKGSDNNLYIATSSGGLGDPVGNSAEWSIFLPKGVDGEDAVLPQNLDTTDSPTFSKITLTSNGEIDNISIGDDVLLGDGNIANHLVIIGKQDATQGGIVLGDNKTEQVSSYGSNLSLDANNDIILNPGSTYAYIGTPTIGGETRIATIGDISNATPDETSFTVNGGSLGTQPTFDGVPLFSGTYVKTGPMVHFQIQVDMDNITNFGTGQYYVDLPFPAKYGYQVREGCLHDISTDRQYAIGGHVSAGQSRLNLFFTDTNGQDQEFDHNSPITLAVADNFHVSGTYISN